MFSTIKQKIILGVYIFILLSIPAGTYLASQHTAIQSKASEPKATNNKKVLPLVTPKPSPSLSPAQRLLQQLNNPQSTPQPSASAAAPEGVPTSYGPTLSFKVALEGRPADNQTTKLFVGIMEGSLTTNPKFLLSFTVDLPASGQYSGLSLAGLNPGTKYTALLKGTTQIATSSAFTMSPAVTNLNDGQAINLLSGDLNDDNVVNNTDLAIMQKALGASATSRNWNDAADLNKDGIINAFDLGIVIQNIGKVGASGAWTSPIPKVSTASASLNTPYGGVPEGQEGYWFWLPK